MSIVTRIWAQQPGKFFVACSKVKVGQGWKEKWFRPIEFNEFDDWVRANSHLNLYFCPHGFDKKVRRKESAVLPKLLWADLDEVDPENIRLRPSVAWQTSPGRYSALWKTNRPMTEEMNREWSYFLGSDKSGWDLTQVLRIPGTRNYKYKAEPRGRLLWGQGPLHEFTEIKETMKQKVKKKFEIGEDLDPKEIYSRYKNKLKHAIRRDIQATTASDGKRSEVLYSLWEPCFMAGMTIEEAIVLLRSTVWNKFAGRRGELDQLTREAHKVYEQLETNGKKRKRLMKNVLEAEGDADDDDGIIAMSEVQATNVDWLHPGWIPKNALTILEGDPGVGKSYLMQVISKMTTDGERMPTRRNIPGPKPSNVIYFDAENDMESVTKPRLDDNGIRNPQRFLQTQRLMALDDPDDMEKLEISIRKHKPVLLVFDTINTYMGAGDTHKASEVQQILSQLAAIARKYNLAVVLIRHLTKGGKDKLQYRGQGSIAFMGMARAVHTVAKHPREDDMLIVKTTKMNFGKPEFPLKYSIDELPAKLGRDERSILKIHDFDATVTDEELNAPQKVKAKTGNDDAKAEAFLKENVRPEGSDLAAIIRMAEARGLTAAIINKALEKLEARVEKIRRKTIVFL
jgi:RecA-family ATPase